MGTYTVKVRRRNETGVIAGSTAEVEKVVKDGGILDMTDADIDLAVVVKETAFSTRCDAMSLQSLWWVVSG